MVAAAFTEFFVAEVGAAAALIGLLFVAISVAPERISGPTASLVEQARASSALTCFLLPLTLALLPGAHLAIPAIVLSFGGLLFVAATLRRYLATPRRRKEPRDGLLGLVGFTAVLGVILAYGIVALVAPTGSSATPAIASATIASILLGVERAWALIGGRPTSRTQVLRDLVQGQPHGATPPATRESDSSDATRED
ncbi:hypothetical protein [Curtobacterium sp. MCBD17_003]|uniref:hypothetical protein n=1 Tax=Curtobacterium sp. MCBD17_003 TaxID=2175667 RepID=UPI000DA93EC5|nr:hypothetical protein [Curtobacterium sp. MCBD17_003]WIE55074.1 hypothetical protein DEI88_002370 [Curtobacterium sp. MCBD17_003]